MVTKKNDKNYFQSPDKNLDSDTHAARMERITQKWKSDTLFRHSVDQSISDDESLPL